MRLLSAGLAGVVFGLGLLLSGMTRPDKVVGFLDLTGAWDPSLGLVMAGAIGVHLVAYRLVPKLKKPLFSERFELPTRRAISVKLLAGAALFGVGWALGGFCPGPAIVSFASGSRDALLFGAAMLAGMYLHHLGDRRFFSEG